MSLNGYAIDTLKRAARTGKLILEDEDGNKKTVELSAGEILSVVKWLAQHQKGGDKPKTAETPEDFQSKVTCR